VITTTYRVFEDQHAALQRAALDRRLGGEAVRMDGSAILRELLDQAGFREST